MSTVFPHDMMRNEPIVVPPAVLPRNDAEHSWAALNELGPCKVLDFFDQCDFGLLFFCSDRHEVNGAIFKHAAKSSPNNVGAAWSFLGCGCACLLFGEDQS